MKHEPGTKVRVLKKTVGDKIELSCNLRIARKDGQPFLYVVDWNKYKDVECYVLSNTNNAYKNGDFYAEDDVELYREEVKVYSKQELKNATLELVELLSKIMHDNVVLLNLSDEDVMKAYHLINVLKTNKDKLC